MVNKQSIREMLNFQELTEEEKQRRGILGRLYGPCASITDATRNGRMYTEELWENVFNKNDIVKEMFENGGIPMELDHPVGREETDSNRIAAMLPEPPKRDKDGHLVCYVDIIDTPCGKIAYQLAKYGYKLGISSRGSGDVLGDDSVDPDTYDFTTFDLVLLPAVKDARLSMCEGLDRKKLKLAKALKESYNSSSKEDKIAMKTVVEDLDLGIDLEEDKNNNLYDFEVVPKWRRNNKGKKLSEAEDKDVKEQEEEIEDEEIEEVEDNIKDDKESEDKDNITVGDLVKELKDFDKKAVVEFKPIVIGEIEYPVENLSFDDSEEGKLYVNIDYNSEVSDNIDEVEDAVEDEEVIDEVEDNVDEVIDDKSDEVIENLKEAIRQNAKLEKEVKDLKKAKTVSDTEVQNLKEDLDKYKLAFTRISGVAAEGKKSEGKIKDLTEQLNQKNSLLRQKDVEIAKIKQSQQTRINESANTKISSLTEKLNTANKELANKENQLTEQAQTFNKKLNERTEITKKYRDKANEYLNEYINFRASMLGVGAKEIINKLNENYSIQNINKVCDSILSNGMQKNSLGFNKSAKIRINESKQSRYEEDDLSDLYELAGLDN